MQKALERSNPHRRHIAEFTNNLNMDYIRERIRRDQEPIHFGGLKSELITKNLIGGSLAFKPINYQADVISAFSVNSRMPKPNMSYHPDTLAVGQPIRYSGTVKNIITPSEYQNNQAVARTGVIDDIEKVRDMSNLYGSGRRPIGLPKPRVVGGKIKKMIKKK